VVTSQPQRAITVVVWRGGGRTVADSGVQEPRAVDGGTGRGPNASLPGAGSPVDARGTSGGHRNTDEPAVVVAAVAVEAAERYPHPTLRQRQRPPLLLDGRIHPRRVEAARPGHAALRRVEGVQPVPQRLRELSCHEQAIAVGVIDRGAGDAERIDVPARQGGPTDRSAQVATPQNLAVDAQCIDRVVFGHRDDSIADHEWLAIDGTVEKAGPRRRQLAAGRICESVVPVPCRVVVVRRPGVARSCRRHPREVLADPVRCPPVARDHRHQDAGQG